MESSRLTVGAGWALNIHLAAAQTTIAAFTSSLVTVVAVSIDFIANNTSLSQQWVASVSWSTSLTASTSVSRGAVVTGWLTV